jgi:hypothetical protein
VEDIGPQELEEAVKGLPHYHVLGVLLVGGVLVHKATRHSVGPREVLSVGLGVTLALASGYTLKGSALALKVVVQRLTQARLTHKGRGEVPVYAGASIHHIDVAESGNAAATYLMAHEEDHSHILFPATQRLRDEVTGGEETGQFFDFKQIPRDESPRQGHAALRSNCYGF